jgi:hypothetical protein
MEILLNITLSVGPFGKQVAAIRHCHGFLEMSKY